MVVETSAVYHIPDFDVEYVLLVVDPKRNIFLCTVQNDKLTLPSFVPYEHHNAEVSHINQYVKEKFGLYTTVLRYVHEEIDQNKKHIERVFILESHTIDSVNNWVGIKVLYELNFASPKHWFWASKVMNKEYQSIVSWANFGWFQQVKKWIVNILGECELEQIRTWERSSVIRVTKDQSIYYFKAAPQSFLHEPGVTKFLYLQSPTYAPEVIATTENGWMLMKNVTGVKLTNIKKIETWERTLSEYAELQTHMVTHRTELVLLNCPVRSVKQVICRLDDFAHSLEPSPVGEELKHSLPRLKDIGLELLALNLPSTLEHGDFWNGNVIVNEGSEILFFDWSDCSISHPFFSMVKFLEDESFLPKEENIVEKLKNAYLKAWESFESRENLQRALELSLILGCISYAMTYQIEVLPSMEDQDQHRGNVLYLVELALQRLQEI